MESLACLNGELMPVDQARVPIWDRGFLFGDAIYEVYRLYQGRLWLQDKHTTRLPRSLAEMGFPEVALDAPLDRIRPPIDPGGIEEGVAHIQITRGGAP